LINEKLSKKAEIAGRFSRQICPYREVVKYASCLHYIYSNLVLTLSTHRLNFEQLSTFSNKEKKLCISRFFTHTLAFS